MATVTITLRSETASIDPNTPDTKLISRLSENLGKVIHANEADFFWACEETFELAKEYSRKKTWTLIGPNESRRVEDEMSNDLTKLAVYVQDTVANYAIFHRESGTLELLDYDVALHATDFEGNTPLHIAAATGRADLVEHQMLGSFIVTKNKAGKTPLQVAIEFGNHSFVSRLLEKNPTAATTAMIECQGDKEYTFNALGFAVAKGEVECIDSIFTYINKRKKELNWKNENLRDFLAVKCTKNQSAPHALPVPDGNILHLAILFDQPRALQHLVTKHHINVESCLDWKNFENFTPLHLAVTLDKTLHVYVLANDKTVICEDGQGRSPAHHAAERGNYLMLRLLNSRGADLVALDNDSKTPQALLEGKTGSTIEHCRAFLGQYSKSQDPLFSSAKNLVFCGGGPKGLAYLGVLQSLHEKKLLRDVVRVAGTSAGAITAALVAIGCDIDDLQQKLSNLNLKDFLDLPQLIGADLKSLQSLYKVLIDPANLTKGVISAFVDSTGVCDGEKFREWIENIIQENTGLKYCTFGELANKIKEEPGKYKHLHVYASKVGGDPDIVRFSSEDPSYADIIISDALRTSMSIPVLFQSHTIHTLSLDHGQRSRHSRPDIGTFVDGGLLYNFPLESFDRNRYLSKKDTLKNPDHPVYNSETLGFRFYSSTSSQKLDQTPSSNIKDIAIAIAKLYYSAEDYIRHQTSSVNARVVNIDAKHIGLLSFNISDQDKNMLITSGKEATSTFLAKYQDSHLIEEFKFLQESIENLNNNKKTPRDTALQTKIRNAARKKATLQAKKALLEQARHPSLPLPAHFDILLERGYFHLYDHLLLMRVLTSRSADTLSVIKNSISFSDFSYAVIEARQAIIEHVDLALGDLSLPVVLIIGNTGVGKSTSLYYLQGQPLQVTQNGYEPANSDEPTIIGNGNTSITFFPNVKKLDTLTLVDFPGFSDSNGPAVSLGIEMAFKHLVDKYHPKILLLESINSQEVSRGAHIGGLAQTLKRLLVDESSQQPPNNGIKLGLGITKYLNNTNFTAIRNAENQQRTDFKRQVDNRIAALEHPGEDELLLQGSISQLQQLRQEYENELESFRQQLTLTGYEEDRQNLQADIRAEERRLARNAADINEKQQQLNRLQQARQAARQELISTRDEELRSFTPTPTKDINTNQQALQEKELAICNVFGIGVDKLIRFQDLEHPNNLSSILSQVHAIEATASISQKNELHADTERLIKEKFESSVKNLIISRSSNIEDMDAFRKEVFASSFIRAVLSSSHPEIGEFFHLPEMDPKIVQDLSQNVIDGCLKGLIKSYVSTLELPHMTELNSTFGKQASKGKKEELDAAIEALQTLVLDLAESYYPSSDTTRASTLQAGAEVLAGQKLRTTSQKWQDLELKIKGKIDKAKKIAEEASALNFLDKMWNALQIDLSTWKWKLGARWEQQEKKINQAAEKTVDMYFDEAIRNLGVITNELITLRQLKNIIITKENIDACLRNNSLNYESPAKLMKSLEARIDIVKGSYGKTEWEAQVAALKPMVERVALSLILGLFLKDHPDYEIIEFVGDIEKTRVILSTMGFFDNNSIVVVDKNKKLMRIIKKYTDQGALRSKLITAARTQNLAMTSVCWLANERSTAEQQTQQATLLSVLPVFEETMKMDLTTPLVQLLILDAIKTSYFSNSKEGAAYTFQFGKASWNYFFGDIGKEEPMLPSNIDQILFSDSPGSKDKKIYQTHSLILLPKTLRGNYLSLNYLQSISGDLQNARSPVHIAIEQEVTSAQSLAVGPYWVLISKESIQSIPESRLRFTYIDTRACAISLLAEHYRMENTQQIPQTTLFCKAFGADKNEQITISQADTTLTLKVAAHDPKRHPQILYRSMLLLAVITQEQLEGPSAVDVTTSAAKKGAKAGGIVGGAFTAFALTTAEAGALGTGLTYLATATTLAGVCIVGAAVTGGAVLGIGAAAYLGGSRFKEALRAYIQQSDGNQDPEEGNYLIIPRTFES